METKAYYLEEAARHLKAANEALRYINDNPSQNALHQRIVLEHTLQIHAACLEMAQHAPDSVLEPEYTEQYTKRELGDHIRNKLALNLGVGVRTLRDTSNIDPTTKELVLGTTVRVNMISMLDDVYRALVGIEGYTEVSNIKDYGLDPEAMKGN